GSAVARTRSPWSPSRSSLERPVAPLLDLVELAARSGRVVPGPVLVVEQPLGEVPPVLRRQGPFPLRPTRHVVGRLLAAQPRLLLLVHRVRPVTAPVSQRQLRPSYQTAPRPTFPRRTPAQSRGRPTSPAGPHPRRDVLVG